MEIVSIFVIENESLYAVQFEGTDTDEFDLLFDKWQDVEYLESFFEANKSDLQNEFWGDISIEEAVSMTIEEAEIFEDYIRTVSKNKSVGKKTLDKLVFTPLHRNVYNYEHVKSKSYGVDRPSWLRIYAIRVAENLYVVSGGAIKLTKTMNNREHLLLELQKLEITKAYLKEIGFNQLEDIGYLEIKNHD